VKEKSDENVGETVIEGGVEEVEIEEE